MSYNIIAHSIVCLFNNFYIYLNIMELLAHSLKPILN